SKGSRMNGDLDVIGTASRSCALPRQSRAPGGSSLFRLLARHSALKNGFRGLPGGDSLAELLHRRRRKKRVS
ncbi:MAG: hypothetical protein ACREHD_29720, partial [Pirellulales bacterium]